MSTLKPDDLRIRLQKELYKISGDVGLLPEINNSNDFAKPFIEIDVYGYNYVCRERGTELFRKIPFDIDELIFEVFSYVTFKMATKWELQNRKDGEDFRRQLFAKQFELMGQISAEFGNRTKQNLSQMLKNAPFVD